MKRAYGEVDVVPVRGACCEVHQHLTEGEGGVEAVHGHGDGVGGGAGGHQMIT